MKWIGRVVVVVLVVFAVVMGLQIVASESGEVAVLATTDSNGEVQETRVWIVELNGSWYLRSGGASGWLARLTAEPSVGVTRDTRTHRFIAAPEPDKRAAVNALMQEKYGWADSYVGMLFGRDDAVPVRLQAALE